MSKVAFWFVFLLNVGAALLNFAIVVLGISTNVTLSLMCGLFNAIIATWYYMTCKPKVRDRHPSRGVAKSG